MKFAILFGEFRIVFVFVASLHHFCFTFAGGVMRSAYLPG